jgi:hypothetical protein
MTPRDRTRSRRRVVIAILIGSALSLSFLGALLIPRLSTSNVTLPTAYIELRAVKNYDNWLVTSQTPASVVAMITNLRTSVGNRPLSLYAIVTGPQVPTASLSKSNPITLDSFLLQAQQAAGGQIIPELNLNYYTSDIKSLPLNQIGNYCDPKDHTICGPGWFFLVSSQLLSLKAISSDPKRTVLLEAWDQFSRDVVTAGLPKNTTTVVFQELKAQGWVNLLLKTEHYFSDNGYAWGVANAPDTTNLPVLGPNLKYLSQLPANDRPFIQFDRQIQNTPTPATALYDFLGVLTRTQQGAALTNLASLQSAYGYTFIYPVLTYTTRDSVAYNWDATINKQSNGQSFMSLIGQLITQYG